MFDDFRQQADGSEFEEKQAEVVVEQVETGETVVRAPLLSQRPKRILGMTAPQRFVIAVLVMLEVCLLGSMFLLVSQKIVPTIFY